MREWEARLRAELLRLPPRYHAVIELRHFQDFSHEEIAVQGHNLIRQKLGVQLFVGHFGQGEL